jgi:hypothetical protein
LNGVALCLLVAGFALARTSAWGGVLMFAGATLGTVFGFRVAAQIQGR